MQMLAALKAKLKSPSMKAKPVEDDEDTSDSVGIGYGRESRSMLGDISSSAKSLFSGSSKRTGMPTSERVDYEDFPQVNIVELFEEVELRCGMSLISVDIHKTLHLGVLAIDRAFSVAIVDKSILKMGLMLVEWSFAHETQTNRIPRLSCARQASIATGHKVYQFQMTMHLLADVYHAKRAKAWYKNLLSNPRCSFNYVEFEERNEINANSAEFIDAYVWLDYVKVLLCLGEVEQAAVEIKKALGHYEKHSLRPILLFFAGSSMKGLRKFDLASTYLFESCTEGPPKYFTKLEMMIIISRNIEDSISYASEMSSMESQSYAEDDNDNAKGVNDGAAYEMVYQHMVLEGYVSPDVDYDSWINSNVVWRLLADKCVLLEAFPIACDLYTQGIKRDSTCYNFLGLLWLYFCKSCLKAGRAPDAYLGLKQAYSILNKHSGFGYKSTTKNMVNRAINRWNSGVVDTSKDVVENEGYDLGNLVQDALAKAKSTKGKESKSSKGGKSSKSKVIQEEVKEVVQEETSESVEEITESGTTTFAPNTFEWFVSGPIEPVNDLFKEILGKNPLLSQNIIGNSASFHKILKRLQAIVRGMRSRAELAKGMLDVGSTTPNKNSGGSDARPIYSRSVSKLVYVSCAPYCYPMFAFVRTDLINRCSRIHLTCAFGPNSINLHAQSLYDTPQQAMIESEQDISLRLRYDFAPPLEHNGPPMLTSLQRDEFREQLVYNGSLLKSFSSSNFSSKKGDMARKRTHSNSSLDAVDVDDALSVKSGNDCHSSHSKDKFNEMSSPQMKRNISTGSIALGNSDKGFTKKKVLSKFKSKIATRVISSIPTRTFKMTTRHSKVHIYNPDLKMDELRDAITIRFEDTNSHFNPMLFSEEIGEPSFIERTVLIPLHRSLFTLGDKIDAVNNSSASIKSATNSNSNAATLARVKEEDDTLIGPVVNNPRLTYVLNDILKESNSLHRYKSSANLNINEDISNGNRPITPFSAASFVSRAVVKPALFEDFHRSVSKVLTNIAFINVAKGGLIHKTVNHTRPLTFHIMNINHATQIKLFDFASSKTIIVHLPREFIGREVHVSNKLRTLLQIMDVGDIWHHYSLDESVVLGSQYNDYINNHMKICDKGGAAAHDSIIPIICSRPLTEEGDDEHKDGKHKHGHRDHQRHHHHSKHTEPKNTSNPSEKKAERCFVVDNLQTYIPIETISKTINVHSLKNSMGMSKADSGLNASHVDPGLSTFSFQFKIAKLQGAQYLPTETHLFITSHSSVLSTSLRNSMHMSYSFFTGIPEFLTAKTELSKFTFSTCRPSDITATVLGPSSNQLGSSAVLTPSPQKDDAKVKEELERVAKEKLMKELEDAKKADEERRRKEEEEEAKRKLEEEQLEKEKEHLKLLEKELEREQQIKEERAKAAKREEDRRSAAEKATKELDEKKGKKKGKKGKDKDKDAPKISKLRKKGSSPYPAPVVDDDSSNIEGETASIGTLDENIEMSANADSQIPNTEVETSIAVSFDSDVLRCVQQLFTSDDDVAKEDKADIPLEPLGSARSLLTLDSLVEGQASNIDQALEALGIVSLEMNPPSADGDGCNSAGDLLDDLIGIGHSQNTTEQRRKLKMIKLAEDEAKRLKEEAEAEEKRKKAAEEAKKKELQKKNKIDITALTANSGAPREKDAKAAKFLEHQQNRLDAQDFLVEKAIDAKKLQIKRDKVLLELIERGKDALNHQKIAWQAFLNSQSQAIAYLFEIGKAAIERCLELELAAQAEEKKKKKSPKKRTPKKVKEEFESPVKSLVKQRIEVPTLSNEITFNEAVQSIAYDDTKSVMYENLVDDYLLDQLNLGRLKFEVARAGDARLSASNTKEKAGIIGEAEGSYGPDSTEVGLKEKKNVVKTVHVLEVGNSPVKLRKILQQQEVKSTAVVSHIIQPKTKFSKQINVNEIQPHHFETAESLKRALRGYDDDDCIEPQSASIKTNLSVDIGIFQHSHKMAPILPTNEYTYDYLVSDPTFGLVSRNNNTSSTNNMSLGSASEAVANSKASSKKVPLNKRGNRFFVSPSIDDSHETTDIFLDPQRDKTNDSLEFITNDAASRSAIKKSSLVSYKNMGFPGEKAFTASVASIESPALGSISDGDLLKSDVKDLKTNSGPPAYRQSHCGYIAYWQARLLNLAKLYPDLNALRKAVKQLQQAPVRQGASGGLFEEKSSAGSAIDEAMGIENNSVLSKAEAIVALAGSEGSVAEALGLLVSVGSSSSSSDFRREVALTARLIDLSDLLSFIPGIRGFLNGDSSSGKYNSSKKSKKLSSPHSISIDSSNPLSSGEGLNNVIGASHDSFTIHETTNESDNANYSSSHGNLSKQDVSYLEKDIFLNPFKGKIKLFGQVASSSLPHLNMTTKSPVVRRRASAVFEELKAKMRLESDVKEGVATSEAESGLSKSGGANGGNGGVRLPSLSTSYPEPGEKFRIGTILKGFKEANNIESPLVVLTRREALKAYNEEILTRSENYDALMKKAVALRLGLISYK